MLQLSQHELDAKINRFMAKKEHQFPQLRNERYYIERTDSVKPVEKHRTSISSRLFPNVRLAHGH